MSILLSSFYHPSPFCSLNWFPVQFFFFTFNETNFLFGLRPNSSCFVHVGMAAAVALSVFLSAYTNMKSSVELITILLITMNTLRGVFTYVSWEMAVSAVYTCVCVRARVCLIQGGPESIVHSIIMWVLWGDSCRMSQCACEILRRALIAETTAAFGRGEKDLPCRGMNACYTDQFLLSEWWGGREKSWLLVVYHHLLFGEYQHLQSVLLDSAK